MTHLGSLHGTGRLIISGEDIGGVEYQIDVRRPRYLMEASGVIAGDDAILWKAYHANGATLKIETGETITIIVTQSNVGSGRATIAISGPVPGF